MRGSKHSNNYCQATKLSMNLVKEQKCLRREKGGGGQK